MNTVHEMMRQNKVEICRLIQETYGKVLNNNKLDFMMRKCRFNRF